MVKINFILSSIFHFVSNSLSHITIFKNDLRQTKYKNNIEPQHLDYENLFAANYTPQKLQVKRSRFKKNNLELKPNKLASTCDVIILDNNEEIKKKKEIHTVSTSFPA